MDFFLGNFKAFGRKQKIPFKPITLVFGPNSSGKSSIIHAEPESRNKDKRKSHNRCWK